MHQDITVADLDVSAAAHAGDVGLGGPELAGGDEFQRLFELGLGARHIQADGFADVVQPAPPGGLVGVALSVDKRIGGVVGRFQMFELLKSGAAILLRRIL